MSSITKIGKKCLVGDGAHASIPRLEYGIPYLTSKNFKVEGIDLSDLSYISVGDYEKHFRDNSKALTKPKSDDLILSIIGSIGAPYLVKKSDKFGISSSVAIIRPQAELDPSYLFYYLKSSGVQNYVEAIKSGAAQGFLSLEMIRSIPLEYPSHSNQQRIASILSAYDDLIENNNKRIALLEQMAEQIYKEWFVRMRFPGYENAEIVKGLPNGWEVVPIGNLFSFYIGGGWGADNQSPEFSEAAYVIRGTDIPIVSKGIPNKEVLRFHKRSNLNSRILKQFDIVFEVSGGSSDQWLGRNFMITKELLESYEGKVMCASFCKLIRPDINKVSPYFLDQFLKLYYSTGLVSTFQVQSTGISNYQFESFAKYQIIIKPKDDIMNKFTEIMSPLYSEINLLGRQLVILKQTRDLLLPRLISGKLKVKDIEQPKLSIVV